MNISFHMFCFILLSVVMFSCKNENIEVKAVDSGVLSDTVTHNDTSTNQHENPLVTFVELGSVNCIPCKKMQPVMKAIEKKYGEQIRVIFYDVWKPDQNKYAEEYGIRLIPTQVFLDKDGKEIFRHEGFFPEEEIDIFLQKQGLKAGKQS